MGKFRSAHEPETHVIPLAIAAALPGDRSFIINGADFDTETALRSATMSTSATSLTLMSWQAKCSCTGGVHTFNFGTGVGTTVMEVVGAVNRAAGRSIPVQFGPRRPGDPPVLVASA